jgi:hypothetical protein
MDILFRRNFFGLKAVFRVPADGAKHPGSFRAVAQHVREDGATITSLRGGGLCWQLSVAVLHR